jgi:hypothetical protein
MLTMTRSAVMSSTKKDSRAAAASVAEQFWGELQHCKVIVRCRSVQQDAEIRSGHTS